MYKTHRVEFTYFTIIDLLRELKSAGTRHSAGENGTITGVRAQTSSVNHARATSIATMDSTMETPLPSARRRFPEPFSWRSTKASRIRSSQNHNSHELDEGTAHGPTLGLMNTTMPWQASDTPHGEILRSPFRDRLARVREPAAGTPSLYLRRCRARLVS